VFNPKKQMKVIKKCAVWFLGEIKWIVEYQFLHLRVFWKEVGEMFDNSLQGLAYRIVFLVGLVTILFALSLGVFSASKVIIAELPFTKEYVAGKIFKAEKMIIVNKVVEDTTVEIEQIEEIEESVNIDEIVKKVYQLESSSGKNDFSKCTAIGKTNPFGYAIPSPKKYICFDSYDEVAGLVGKWFEKKLVDHTLEESLCIYNTGVKTEACGYVNKYNSLK